MNQLSGQLSGQLLVQWLQDRIIGEVPYDIVADCIPCIDMPIECWTYKGRDKNCEIDLPDGQRVRFRYKQSQAIKNPVCVHCNERGVKFLIVKYPRSNNPNQEKTINKIMLVTQRNVLLTRDHIKPRCQGGTSDYDNIQVLCETCNTKKSIEDGKKSMNKITQF